MTDIATRQTIDVALRRLPAEPLLAGVTQLFGALGYASDRRFDLDDDAPATFVAQFARDARFNQVAALVQHWRAVRMVFQLSGDELRQGGQLRLDFDQRAFERQMYQSFLFFAIELDPAPYSRAQLATITREINKLFVMPVSVVFRYGTLLTLALVTHRPNQRDGARDVLEKVSLIRDIRLDAPHRAHIEILKQLALPSLAGAHAIGGFDDLQRAWARTLDISELNRRFYREIANWYFWAVRRVTFPPGDGKPAEVRNAESMIRLLTRLIFVWFLKEKGLAPDALFDQRRLSELLASLEPGESSYYKAILQNLFFATLNTEMADPQRPRRFRGRNTSGGRDSHHGIATVYRYEDILREPQAALDLFLQVPFLNGGLFECLDPGENRRPETLVDGFSDRADNPLHVPNELFFSARHAEDLNDVYGTRGRRYDVRGLIDILHDYKFTVAENTPVEEDVALDPELLGQVFENLLAAYNPETETTARKETGSFYTPRGVVEYMVDESLLLYLRAELLRGAPLIPGFDAAGLDERLRTLLAYTDTPQPFGADETAHLIAAIDELKVIDPACGSGAFPMGVLQKLVYILGKLDPGNERWREQQRRRAVRETESAYRIGDQDERKRRLLDIDDTFEHNSSEYGRKLYLIENSIYGVDIQPIAVQIAKLRCFIALVVDQRTDDGRPNRGIRPLPNLETRIVAADALNGVRWQGTLRSQAVIDLEAALKAVRSRHFSARSPATKQKYRQEDERLRAELSEHLRAEGIPGVEADLLARWDPYRQNTSATFFDPEWMFGLTRGFDIVIANPPYVRQEQIRALKPRLEAQYNAYTGTADLYVYFYERGVNLLREGGVLTYISSNKYFRAGYGQKLRRLLANSLTIHQLIDFGDAPVFTAIAYPSIIIATRGAPAAPAKQTALTPGPAPLRERGEEETHHFRALTWNPAHDVAEFAEVFRTTNLLLKQKALTPDGWRLEGEATQRLLEKLRRAGTPLGEYVSGRFYYGIKTGFNEAFVVDRATRDALIAEHPSSAALLKPFLRGRDVKRWRVVFADQYLIKIESSENKRHPWSGTSQAEAERVFAKTYPAIHARFEQYRQKLIDRDDQGHYFWELRSCVYWQEFEQPKIVYPDIYEHQSFTYETQQYYAANTCYFIPTHEKWLTGLLNSRAVEWFYSMVSNTVRGGYMRAFSDYMRLIPIPACPDPRPIEALVEQILALKAADAGADVVALERAIDERVYGLYGLTAEEVRAVEE